MNIRFPLTLVVIALMTTAACKKENKPASPLIIVGNWQLSSYSGGVAGFRHKTVDAGANVQLAFGDDGSYRKYDKGAMTTQDKFTMIKNYAFTNYYTQDALQVGSKIAGAVSITRGTQDTLFITPGVGNPDIMTFEYVKEK